MAAGTVVDTGFLIALANPRESQHAVAQEYWKYLVVRHKRPIYLPTIVVLNSR